MSGRQLADRMELRPASLAGLEKRESSRSITIRTLEKTASALGCRLVYAFVPLEDTLEGIVQRRARAIAARTINSVSHSMALERQSVDSRITKSQIDAIAEQLVQDLPRSFWDDPR